MTVIQMVRFDDPIGPPDYRAISMNTEFREAMDKAVEMAMARIFGELREVEILGVTWIIAVTPPVSSTPLGKEGE